MDAVVEVERKFRVPDVPSLDDWASQRIDQGYLAVTDEVEVRVRRKGGRHLLTVKSSPALSRVEEELTISAEAFGRLWPLTAGRRVVKTRWTREGEGGLLLELDLFEEALRGLAVLEVEFPSEDAAKAWTPPAWAAEELTGDPRWANQALAVHGAPHL